MNQEQIIEFSKEIYEVNVSKGFYEEPRSSWRVINLFHSEVSEAFEITRKNPDAVSEKIPPYSWYLEEIADVLIRLLDSSYHMFKDNTDFQWFDNLDDEFIDSIKLCSVDEFLECLHAYITECNVYEKLDFHRIQTVIDIITVRHPEIWKVARAKVDYNKTRPYKHGKIF